MLYIREAFLLLKEAGAVLWGARLGVYREMLRNRNLLELFFSSLNKVSVLEAKVNTFMTGSQLSCVPSLCPNTQVCNASRRGKLEANS